MSDEYAGPVEVPTSCCEDCETPLGAAGTYRYLGRWRCARCLSKVWPEQRNSPASLMPLLTQAVEQQAAPDTESIDEWADRIACQVVEYFAGTET